MNNIKLSQMKIFFKFPTNEYTDVFRSYHLASRFKFLVSEALVFKQSPFKMKTKYCKIIILVKAVFKKKIHF